MGNWIWNTRDGTYEWRESSGWLTWAIAIIFALLFGILVLMGVAMVRQLAVSDTSNLARVVAAGDYASLLEWGVALGAWGLTLANLSLQQYWPFLLILVPGAAAFVLMRKG
jgi:hypothetical protein